MKAKTHHYHTRTEWTGNLGAGTAHYTAYSRNHIHRAPGKPDIPGSADPAFRGDPARWNPEELLLAAASACHKLWYLHHCADHGITVLAYSDDAEAEMNEAAGRMTAIRLKPRVTISAASDPALALALHHDAHREQRARNRAPKRTRFGARSFPGRRGIPDQPEDECDDHRACQRLPQNLGQRDEGCARQDAPRKIGRMRRSGSIGDGFTIAKARGCAPPKLRGHAEAGCGVGHDKNRDAVRTRKRKRARKERTMGDRRHEIGHRCVQKDRLRDERRVDGTP